MLRLDWIFDLSLNIFSVKKSENAVGRLLLVGGTVGRAEGLFL